MGRSSAKSGSYGEREIHLRGSSFGELIKIADFTEKLNDTISTFNDNIVQLHSDLYALISTSNSHTYKGNFSRTIDGAADTSTLVVPAPASGSSLTDADALSKKDYESTQVSHG